VNRNTFHIRTQIGEDPTAPSVLLLKEEEEGELEKGSGVLAIDLRWEKGKERWLTVDLGDEKGEVGVARSQSSC
jgi:hypothetical protein